MWTCSSCCQENEDHAIFCRQCGGMRGDVRPPAPDGVIPRSPLEPKPSGESVVPEWRPDPPGCGFLAGWTAATAGAEFLAGIAISVVYRICCISGGHPADDLGIKIVMGTLGGIAAGTILGGAQTLMLSMAAPGRRWSAWWIATLLVWPLGSAAWTLAYHALGFHGQPPILVEGALGALFGVLVGAVQGFVLRRRGLRLGPILWMPVNALAFAAMNAVHHALLSGISGLKTGCIFAVAYGATIVRGMILGLLTGLALTWLLRRAARAAPPPPAQ